MAGLTKREKMERLIGPQVLEILALKLTGNAGLNGATIGKIFQFLENLPDYEGDKTPNNSVEEVAAEPREAGRHAVIVQGGEADRDSDHEADRNEGSEEVAHGGEEEGQDGASE